MQIAMDASMIHLGTQVTAISELDDIDSLVAVYWARVLRFVTFSVGDPDLAQTITQDCFLKAYNGRASFRGECTVNTWLIGIANHLICDHVRLKKFQFWRKARASALDVTEFASFLPSHESSPESKILARERMEQVKTAVDSLSVNQRRVFLLKFFEEMNVEEIAAVTDMPVNTVKTHLHRGIKTIRATLGGTK